MMDSLYWLNQTLAALPAVLWAYVGLGVPWALVVLPRRDWRERALVACVALAAGPVLLTAWMFVLGTAGGAQPDGPLTLDFGPVLGGTVVIALMGAALAWRKARTTSPAPANDVPLANDEKIIIALIIAALALRWLTTAFWPFTAYDPIWVYGYEGRLYTLLGHIPQSTGYYPQFLPLQYTYAQLAVGGVDDHAARAVIPLLHLGSILAAYVLGARLFRRRVGLFAAGLWALYPHVGAWAHVGDLEIPVTFLMTGAAAFSLMAWTDARTSFRRRYALIAGLFLGAAMWTKPTAGGFIWGVLLLVAVDWLRVGGDWRAWWPRFEVAALAGLASIPQGAVVAARASR